MGLGLLSFFKLKNHIKRKLRPYYRSFINIFISAWDFRLKSLCSVRESGKVIFKIHDFGRLTRLRASTFEIKEPETLEWIRSFNDGDNLLDIGANIGIYSLFAANRNIKVVAIEPDALNYALLNLNIRVNNFKDLVLPYCIAIHDKNKFSKFNVSSFNWGGALNSFDNTLDFKGNSYVPFHYQGIYGIKLDSLISKIPFFPNHIKIDVDGNENLILKGAKKLLSNKNLKSVLVELDLSRNDYNQSLSIFEECGMNLLEKSHSKIFNNSQFSNTYNHIFIRK